MLTEEFNYNLPKELIAQEPIRPRDHSRMMVADKELKTIKHRHFYNIVDYLQKGDFADDNSVQKTENHQEI